MPQNIFVPANNLGFEFYVSDFDINPKAADLIGNIRSVTGVGFSTETVEAMAVSSKSGFTQPAPTTKTAKPFTVTIYKENANYKKIADRFHGYSTSDENFYVYALLKYPKTKVNSQIPDYIYPAFISDVSFGDVETNQVQTISFVITPVDAPIVHTGFGAITLVTATPDILTNAGGQVAVSVTGTEMVNGITVQAFVGVNPVAGTRALTSGTATAQSANIVLPANGGTADTVYTIKASLNGVDYAVAVDTVTVSM